MINELSVITQVSKFTGLAADELSTIIDKYCRKYKIYSIPKRSGGTRRILHPAKQIKLLQYAIHEILLKHIPVHDIAKAYIPGLQSPLKQNATLHAKFRYTIRIDFKDFFPSLEPGDLIIPISKFYKIIKEDKSIIRRVLFYHSIKDDRYILPIGAPTSPHISNIILYDLDEKFYQLSLSISKNSAISRYADDLYFSCDIKGGCARFLSGLRKLLKETERPTLTINDKKTLFLSRGTKRIVAGLFITPDGRVSVGRTRKIAIKTAIYKNSKGLLTAEEKSRGAGLLSFIKDSEPEYYNKLALKYGTDFFKLIAD